MVQNDEAVKTNYKLLDCIILEYSLCFKCEQNNRSHIYNIGVHIQNSLMYVENRYKRRKAYRKNA